MNIIFFLFLSFIISAGATPLLISFSKRKMIFDFPEGDNLKIHINPVSILGGLAMFIAVVICLVLFSIFDSKFLAITFGCLVIFLLGIWDDLRWKHASMIKPVLKFLFLILCVLVASAVLSFVDIAFNFFPLLAVPVLLTAVYIFVVINSINYQDGIDGLAGGLSLISFVGFIILSIFLNNNFTMAIAVIFCGAILSFLIFNFPPAKIFMGDSGAYTLGFALTVLAISFSKPYNIYSALSPIFIIGLPVFDGVFSNVRRIIYRKSIFLGDRNHFYDKLLRFFSIRNTLFISYSLQILSVFIGLIIYLYV